MEQKNETRDRLERMSTQELDELLHAALRRDPADGETVRLILSILKSREPAEPALITPDEEAAWEEYKRHTAKQQKKAVWNGGRVLKTASIIAVICILFSALSQTAEAESVFKRLARWTDSIFELFSPGDSKSGGEYVFETDNPGLRQVYDTLTELGVTEPVVPMWLPEGYELSECKVESSRVRTKLLTTFSMGDREIVYKVNIYSENTPIEYYKDETEVETIEFGETVHNIMRNNDLWVAVWTKDNLECSIYIDCQEDELYKILRSIYTVEDD